MAIDASPSVTMMRATLGIVILAIGLAILVAMMLFQIDIQPTETGTIYLSVPNERNADEFLDAVAELSSSMPFRISRDAAPQGVLQGLVSMMIECVDLPIAYITGTPQGIGYQLFGQSFNRRADYDFFTSQFVRIAEQFGSVENRALSSEVRWSAFDIWRIRIGTGLDYRERCLLPEG